MRGKVVLHPILDALARDVADLGNRMLPFDYQKHIDFI
jgi:hypothetical protein